VHTEQSPPASSTAPDPQTGLGWGLLLTALAWLTCRLVVGARWAPARNPIRFDPSLWARWDTFNYGAITQYGRSFGACNSTALAGMSNPFHATWCGTAAWLPGYPWLIRGLQTTGISLPDAGLMISWAAMAIALFVVWLGWARSLHPVRALFVMVAFGVFPGAVYNFALFPTSVALAGVVGAILAATRERFLVAAVLMTVAGLSYPSAWFAAGGLAAGMILVGCSLGARQVVRRGLWGIAGLASLIVLGVHDQIVFGHANAYVLVNTGPGLDTHGFPGEIWIRLVVQRDTAEQRRIGTSAADALAVQGLLAVVMMAVATARTGWTWVETRVVDDVYPAAVGLAVVVSVLLISATGGAWNRSVVLAAPCVICLRRLPFPLLALLVVISAVTTAFVSRAFFAGTLV
jgi:hypothetical protein